MASFCASVEREAPKIGKKTKTPEAPNYSALAQQQGEMNKQAWEQNLLANRPNQSNQFGSLTWSQDPTTGQWTQTNTLNQPQQDIFNQQQANQGLLGNMSNQFLSGMNMGQVDLSGAPAMGQVGQFNQQATDLYNQLAAPQLERQRAAKEAQMAAMGLGMGSGRAYDTQQELLNESENRSGLMAAQAGIQQGNTMFGQQNQLHQQGVSDILNQQNANMQTAQGLLGMQQPMNAPSYNQFVQTNPYQIGNQYGAAQDQYAAQMNQANAGNAAKGQIGSVIGGIAGSFFGPVGTAVGSAAGKALTS